MAGIEDAGYTLYTVQSGEFFPTSDSDNSFPPLTTSFTFLSGCAEQWRIVNPDFPTEVLNSVLQATKGTPPLMKELARNANRRTRQKVMIAAGR